MKSVYLLLLQLALMVACQPHSAKKDVEAYLNKNYGSLGQITVLECSSVDSLYSPFEIYNSIILQYVERNSEVMQEYSKVADQKSLRAMRERLDKAIVISDDDLRQSLNGQLYFTDNPDAASAPKNRIGVKAKFSLEGVENEAFFFYNRNEPTIGHSSLEMKTKVKEITQMHINFIKRQSDMIRMKSSLY